MPLLQSSFIYSLTSLCCKVSQLILFSHNKHKFNNEAPKKIHRANSRVADNSKEANTLQFLLITKPPPRKSSQRKGQKNSFCVPNSSLENSKKAFGVEWSEYLSDISLSLQCWVYWVMLWTAFSKKKYSQLSCKANWKSLGHLHAEWMGKKVWMCTQERFAFCLLRVQRTLSLFHIITFYYETSAFLHTTAQNEKIVDNRK